MNHDRKPSGGEDDSHWHSLLDNEVDDALTAAYRKAAERLGRPLEGAEMHEIALEFAEGGKEYERIMREREEKRRPGT